MSADSPELNAFAARLAGLQPKAGLSRDQMLFEAGRRSAKRPTVWPITSLALAGLALWFAARPATVIESIQFVERPMASSMYVRGEPIDPNNNYLHLRNTVLRHGVDALPQSTSNYRPGPPLTPANLNDFLN